MNSKRLIAKLREAGTTPAAWPDALEAFRGALHVPGAVCFVSSKGTERVEWACFGGLCAETEPRYVEHYARHDPFLPLLNVTPGWCKLSEALPDDLLKSNEWYNDFVRRCGVGDILGRCLVDTPSHAVIFGVQIGDWTPLR